MKSLKLILFIIIIWLFLFNQLGAQIVIDGTITDSDLIPINNALVEIIDEDDSSNVFSTNTNDQGYFNVAVISDVNAGKKRIPDDFIILRNYPNPFNPTTIIYYELPKSENIEIKIYDILGREVRTLFNNFHKAGTYTLEWDGRNNWNSSVSAGVYFCRLKTKDQFKIHKMVLLDGGSNTVFFGNTKKESSKIQIISKNANVLNFTIKVSGNQIITTEFNNVTCNSDTSVSLIVPKVLKTITIGSIGGKIELDNFSLIVPEGAFDIDFDIKLFERTADEWDNDNASIIIGVEGLPYYFNVPLNISIIPNIELRNESYITVGHDYEIPLLNSSQIVYSFLDTKDTLGLLKSKLFPDSAFIGNDLSKIKLSDYKQHKIYFTSKTGFYSGLSHHKHFKIFTYDKPAKDFYYTINTVGNIFERNFDLVKATGFDTVNINWPVEIYVKELKSELYNRGCIYYPTYGLKNMSLLIDQRRIDGINESSIREYTIGIARSYDKEFFLPNDFTGKVDPDRYWFHHALGSWFEEIKWNPNSDDWFYPIDYCHFYQGYHWPDDNNGDNSTAPFYGMRGGAGNDSRSALKHGGGMSSFIKYLDINYSEASILNIYQIIRENGYHPIQAVKLTLSDPYVWWPDYLEQLIEDKLFHFVKANHFDYYSEEGPYLIFGGGYSFKDKEDTLKIFKDIKYPSLSAKAFEIKWNSSNIELSRVMNISLEENENSLIVYGYNVNLPYSYSLLGSGQSFSKDISELVNENISSLIVIVTNAESAIPYTNMNNINLKVWLKKKEIIEFSHCKIKVRLLATSDQSSTYWDPWWYTDGTFTNNTYSGIINTKLQGGNAFGSVQIALDDNHNILNLSVMAYVVDGYEGWNWQWGLTAANIPPTRNDNSINYTYYGTNVCSYVTERIDKGTNPDGRSYENSEYSCDEDALLEIYFEKY